MLAVIPKGKPFTSVLTEDIGGKKLSYLCKLKGFPARNPCDSIC